MKFKCRNNIMGCGVVLNYLEVAEHDKICEYHTVKCTAFKDCKTKCIQS